MKRILIAAVLLAGLTGCAGEDPTAPACDSLDAVQLTVGHISNANVSENGIAAAQPYLSQLRTDLNQLYQEAKTQFAPQAEALRTSVDQLATDLRAAKENPSASTLAAARVSISSVRASAHTLRDAMTSLC